MGLKLLLPLPEKFSLLAKAEIISFSFFFVVFSISLLVHTTLVVKVPLMSAYFIKSLNGFTLSGWDLLKEWWPHMQVDTSICWPFQGSRFLIYREISFAASTAKLIGGKKGSCALLTASPSVPGWLGPSSSFSFPSRPSGALSPWDPTQRFGLLSCSWDMKKYRSFKNNQLRKNCPSNVTVLYTFISTINKPNTILFKPQKLLLISLAKQWPSRNT